MVSKIAFCLSFVLLLAINKAQAAEVWPAETWGESVILTDLDSDFQKNLSGAHWNEVTQTLWVCLNGPGKFWALVPSAVDDFEVDTQSGRRGEWDAPGDLEAITQVDLEEPSVYVIAENENTIRKYDVSTYGSAVLQRSWNLTAFLPAYDGSAGPEGITFVPDEWLRLNGFVDGNGVPYVSQNGMGGLMMVAHQKGGAIYAFDLNPNNNQFNFVGQYRTSRAESSGLEFDRSSGKLYIWHNTGSNYIEVTDMTSFVSSGQRYFTSLKEYNGPKGGNLEGIALSPADSDDRWFFMTDDDNQNGAALMWFSEFEPVVLGNDKYSTNQDMPLEVEFPGLLNNDLGVDSLILTQAPAHGTLEGLQVGDVFDGSFTYRPDAGYAGIDTFTYAAADGEETAKVEITLSPLNTITRTISFPTDDAEERVSDGVMNTRSSDLELMKDSSNQKVGLKFNNITLPPGAVVVNAFIQFTTDETSSEATSLVINGELSSDAPIFNLSSRNLSNRRLTSASVAWQPEPWLVINESGSKQKTPNLASVITEIIDIPEWESGNSLALIISGTGKRVARSFDYSPQLAPRLVIEYVSDQEAELPPEFESVNVRVSTSLDDAEERLSNGAVNTTSTDLELITDSVAQTVGIRFNPVAIPQGAEITDAWIQFATDETSNVSTNLTIFGEDNAAPSAFAATAYNISQRVPTQASVLWEPLAWNIVGEVGANQLSPDLTDIVQEIVDHPDWQSGQAMVFIIQGSGKRVAESFDGSSANAPLLHVEYRR